MRTHLASLIHPFKAHSEEMCGGGEALLAPLGTCGGHKHLDAVVLQTIPSNGVAHAVQHGPLVMSKHGCAAQCNR
jgi:hypothetical protein